MMPLAFAGFKDFDKDITEPAISGGLSQYLAENPDDPKGALKKFQEKVAGLKDGADDFAKPAFDIEAGIAKLNQGFGDLSIPKAERQTLLQNLASDFQGQSPIGKGLMKAALIGWSVEIGAGKFDESKSEAIKEFAKATQGGAELFAGATQSLVDAGKLTQYTNAAKHADIAARLTPGLGVLANSASAWVNASKLASGDGNVGNAIALAGDVLGIVGSGLEAFPVTAPAGAIVGGLGALINAGGEITASVLSNNKEKKEAEAKEKAFNDKRADYLHSVLNDPELERALLASDGRVAQKLTQDLGMDIQDVQALAKKYPALVGDPNTSLSQLDGLEKVAKRLKMDSGELRQFMEAIGQGTTDPNLALNTILDHFEQGTPLSLSTVKDKDELLVSLEREAGKFALDHNSQYRDPSEKKAYENIIKFLEKH